jgi:hypothetical protein
MIFSKREKEKKKKNNNNREDIKSSVGDEASSITKIVSRGVWKTRGSSKLPAPKSLSSKCAQNTTIQNHDEFF